MRIEHAASERSRPPQVVSVDGVVISRDAIAREAQHHPAPTPAAAYGAAARALVVRELLLAEARRLGLEGKPDVDDQGRQETMEDALVRALVGREINTPEPDDATCRRYFSANAKKFRSPDLWAAEHILFAAAQGDEPAHKRARSQAEAAIAALRAEPSRFADLARDHSACTSAAQGGALGQIRRGDTVPAFEAALLALAPGEVTSAPVETQYGFHVVRLARRVESEPLPYEAAKGRIAAYLAESVERRAIAQYVAVLAGRAVIDGVALKAATSPLVQ